MVRFATVLLLVCGLLFPAAPCQAGDLVPLEVFPQLRLYAIDGEKIAFPRGKSELVFVGSCPEIQKPLRAWYSALRKRPIPCLEKYLILVAPPYLHYPFLRGPTLALLRRRVPSVVQARVGVVFLGVREFCADFLVGISEANELLSYLIDTKGRILWHARGAPSDEKVQGLLHHQQKALAP